MTQAISSPPETKRVEANGITINVAISGEGPALVLLHGFPHTWRVWSAVIPELSKRHRVIAPDLRGLGESSRAPDGYEVGNLELDLSGLLDALEVDDAAVVGIDAGAPTAFLHALLRPERVRATVLIESLLGRLPGAEDFFAGGPPWWFGFHSVPGLAETVLEGHEAEYLDFFLKAGTADGRGPERAIRDAFVAAYSGADSLRCAFEHYRALARNAEQIGSAVERRRLTVPTMAIGAEPVGESLSRQLAPLSDDLTSHLIEDCGHIVPLDRPRELLDLLQPFLGAHGS